MILQRENLQGTLEESVKMVKKDCPFAMAHNLPLYRGVQL